MLYELSIPLSPQIVRYDDATPRPEFHSFSRISAGDVNNQTMVKLFTHSGSHVDAPYHFCESGMSIDEIDIQNFIFTNALLIDLVSKKGERIDVKSLTAIPKIWNADLLLLNFGYSKYLSNEAVYRDDFPALTLESAKFLRECLPNLKAIAMDTLSVDGTDGALTGFANHHALLDTRTDGIRPLLIYECIDFSPILGQTDFFKVYGIPLRLRRLDASPVTFIADI